MGSVRNVIVIGLAIILGVGKARAGEFDSILRWRNIGPYRGGRTRAIAGVPSQPNVFYMAPVNGGVFKSTDYGRTWQPIFDDQPTASVGAIAVSVSNPNVIYVGSGEGLHRPDLSVGDGKTWRQLINGLPSNIVQANIAIAPSAPKTLFTAVRTKTIAKLYRSEDGGETWSGTTDDPRPGLGIGGGDLPVVRFDPKNPQIVYSTSVVCWKSTDGGKTWDGWRGAPGGDDYQNVWIDPNNPDIIVLGSDQGAIVTVNGGKSWSSWYNQSTAQLYHVSADNAFPYRLYSGQQESGSAGIKSRGDEGEITFR